MTTDDSQNRCVEFGVTPKLFRKWRTPRFGDANPTPMTNQVWRWLIETRQCAYLAAVEALGERANEEEGPTWCFDRYGQSATEMPDGRTIYVGGEHEDYYDPDFCIFNDVVVVDRGEAAIFGYPRECFPPTDFHSATLVGDRLWIIGNCGYQDERREGTTPVYALCTKTYQIEPLETYGDRPGWIFRHEARFDPRQRAIMIRGGSLHRESEASLVENLDDWQLEVETRRWTRLTNREWPRFELRRNDRGMNCLFWMRSAVQERQIGFDRGDHSSVKFVREQMGFVPDLSLLEDLYRAPLEFEPIPAVEGEFNVYRLRIEGQVVRIVEDHHSIQITFEGSFKPETIATLVESIRQKLERLEQTAYETIDIDSR